MEKQETISATFDYTSFLGASCRKKWTLGEIFTSIAPIFASAWLSTVDDMREPEDRLWQQAFKTLSAQSSDETNLIRLFRLAKSEGIDELKLSMPYELDEKQLSIIVEHTQAKIHHSAQDEFIVHI